MTKDISKYIFNFEKDVNDLRRSLGAKGKNILFVEAHVVQADDETSPPKIELRHIAGDESYKEPMCSHIISEYSKEQNRFSYGLSFYNDSNDTFYHYVSFREDENVSGRFGESNKELMRLFTLYHETGHVLTPTGPEIDVDHPLRECEADAYAAIRFFQKFGRSAARFLSMISWNRAFNLAIGDTAHLTTTVLDKIITDSAFTDFSKLTPDETIALAETYAKAWTPEPAALSAVREAFLHEGGIGLGLLSKTGLSSPNDFAFYIGAKFFQPYLRPKGIVQGGEAFQLPAKDRQKYTALIKDRAAGLDLSDVFKTAAVKLTPEPSLIETLKVSLPAGQKQFIINI